MTTARASEAHDRLGRRPQAISHAANELVPQLTERLRRHGLGEIEVSHGDLRLRVGAGAEGAAPPAAARSGAAGASSRSRLRRRRQALPAQGGAVIASVGVASPAVGFFVYADGLGPGLAVERETRSATSRCSGCDMTFGPRAPARSGTWSPRAARRSSTARSSSSSCRPRRRNDAGAPLQPSGLAGDRDGPRARGALSGRALGLRPGRCHPWLVGVGNVLGRARRAPERHAADAAVPAGHLRCGAARPGGGGRARPAVVAGHSVGEYAALVAAGVLELPAALRLVQRRGELMAAADAEGGMAAVLGLERATVEAVVETIASPTDLVVANDNAPGQIVISGRRDALAAAEEPMRAAGARRLVRLPVSGRVPLAADGGGRRRARRGVRRRGMARRPRADHEQRHRRAADRRRANPRAPRRAGASPVEWVRCVEHMAADGVDLFVECGAWSRAHRHGSAHRARRTDGHGRSTAPASTRRRRCSRERAGVPV